MIYFKHEKIIWTNLGNVWNNSSPEIGSSHEVFLSFDLNMIIICLACFPYLFKICACRSPVNNEGKHRELTHLCTCWWTYNLIEGKKKCFSNFLEIFIIQKTPQIGHTFMARIWVILNPEKFENFAKMNLSNKRNPFIDLRFRCRRSS
jgi:hypothetical protein